MHVYFSGIGGVAIGPLAMLALDTGYQISGSDLQESEMVALLRGRGARVAIGQDGSQIAAEHAEQPIGWFVYSSALPDDHPELQFAKEHGIKISKRDEFLNQILKEKNLRLIAVSGTHGKTTTTGMLIWLFQQLGMPVSYSIGTSISFGPPARYQEGSEYFIYECDEFDKNFLNFTPSFSLIPALDYDHPDTYPTPADYNYAFTDFINQSGKTFLWQEAANQLALSDKSSLAIVSPADPGISSVTLPGEHMRRNAWLAVQAVQTILGIEASDLITHINRFPGTSRRFEKLAENLYSDYAHHPAEIAATIAMAKELNPKVVVVYQPHQNIRQHEIVKAGGYQHCFDGAEVVYWLPTYLSREYQELETLPSEKLIESIPDHQNITPAAMDDELWQNIQARQAAGELVVAMSAGDLDQWLREQLHSN